MGIGIRYQVVQKDNLELVEEIHKVVVHRFRVSDVDDPEIYAAEPIWEWQQSEAGKFVMENALDTPVFQRHLNADTYGYDYAIIAELEKRKYSEFLLRFGKTWK
jgi:hypothetical protein